MSMYSYDNGYSSGNRLEQFCTQLELARNFYDDIEFCPVASSEEVEAHRSRIQQRSPYSSPRNSPPVYHPSVVSSPSLSTNGSVYSGSQPSSKQGRAIPIINPENMTPVYYQAQSSHYSWQPSTCIPIINPATGQPLLPSQYDVTVR
ncbi:hypothetical protein DM01DRAFT_1406347 [Hesseltinella vesiculosa]|uniref:Uncharacterized protein n=1 Tax=Hesseltinella vesiculosa TaxID=101127 RepID=A0A1X2GM03_9FUNG|nr:hypothetical protein DM01DRAFT_1406347 [Hesseltinella vesiculosa]